jgi:hypothetical protein
VAQTLVLQGGAGAFAPGVACVIGSNFEEQTVIAAVNGYAPMQTLQLALAYPNKDVAIFQGPCKFISFNADLALGTRTAYPGTSIDGTNLVYSVPSYGNNGGYPLPMAGAEPETTNGAADPKSGFATYCGARITKLTALNPLATSLEQNGCNWAAGDAVEDPDFPVQNIQGYTSRINMNNPATGNSQMLGGHFMISGMGATTTSTGLQVDNVFADVDCSPYTICGGNLVPPNMFSSNWVRPGGWWYDNFILHYAPQNAAMEFLDHAPGQTSYFVHKDPWGSIQLTKDGVYHFAGAPGGIATGGVGNFGGLISGSGFADTSGGGPALGYSWNFPPLSGRGNTSMQIWDNQPFGGTTDLAISDGTRSGSTATNLRGLHVGNLYVTGSCTGCGSGSGSFPINGTGVSITNPSSGMVSINGTSATNSGLITGGAPILWTMSASIGAQDYNNHTNDSPGFRGYYADNHNLGFNVSTLFTIPSCATTAIFRFINDYFETGGSAIGGIDGAGNLCGWNNTSLHGVMGFSSTQTTAVDTGLSRDSAGAIDVGNGAAGDKSGTLNAATLAANLYKGPATAPTGACSVVGWVFSQDGHVTFCNGSTWITKI